MLLAGESGRSATLGGIGCFEPEQGGAHLDAAGLPGPIAAAYKFKLAVSAP